MSENGKTISCYCGRKEMPVTAGALFLGVRAVHTREYCGRPAAIAKHAKLLGSEEGWKKIEAETGK